MAEAGARQARLALYPNLEASYRYTRLSNITLTNTLLTMPIGGMSFYHIFLNNHTFQATLSYPVTDLFFTILPSVRSARTSVRASEFQVDVERRNVALRGREAYYEYVRALGGRIVAQKSVEQAESHREQVNGLVSAGAAARVELMRIDAQVASARVALAQAELGVQVSGAALRALIDAPPEEEIAVGEDLRTSPEALETTEAALLERALAERVEVRALDTLAEAKRYEIRARAGGRYPQVALQGNAYYQNPNPRNFGQQTSEFIGTWDASVVVRWSPNATAQAQYQMRAAEAQLRQIEANREQLLDGVRVEVAQAFNGYQAARAQLDAAIAGLQASEETYRVRTAQLHAGAAVSSDLIDAETDLTRARLELVDAAIAVRLARARLKHAVGEQ
jgi:outer membrane protein TolC